MRKVTVAALGCAILISFVSLSFAQATKRHDPRPLKGLDASKIPTITDLKAYLAAHRGSQKLVHAADEIVAADRESYVPVSKGTIAAVRSTPNADYSVWRIARAANGTANWMWRARTKNAGPTTQSVSKSDAMATLVGLRQYLGLDDPASELRLMSDSRDELGREHVRFAQYFQNIPVWNRDLYVHFDATGEPSVINGTFEPTPKSVSTTPAIRAEAAEVLAIADLQAKGNWAPVSSNSAALASSSFPTATLVIFPQEGKQPRLAYEVSVVANILQSYYYIIDATTGEIIERFDHYCSLLPETPRVARVSFTDASPRKDRPLTMPLGTFADATAIDLNGVSQHIRTYHHDDGTYYMIWDLPSLNPAKSTLPNQPSGGALTLDLKGNDYAQTSTIFHNTSSDNSWPDRAAVSAHFNTSVAYGYYSQHFNRKAIDNQNGVINSIIHVTSGGAGMDNAYWNGGDKIMVYGDGNIEFKPLAGGLDVAGHEMTHGVTENSANLVYQYQPGALNESMSDVFGVMIDTKDLTIGEQVMLPATGKSFLRSLANPHDPNAFSDQPAKMSEMQQLDLSQDNGGVHINSGIPNHAAGILIQAIGRDKVETIYYRALTAYLTRDAQFLDARRALVSSATDIYGANSAEVNAVKSAFDQVEIFDGGGGGGGSNDKIAAQTGGHNYITFSTDNGQIGYVDLVTDSAFLFVSPGAFARVSDNGASRSSLTTPRDGKSIYFVNQSGHLCFMDNTGTFHIFNTTQIQQDGDLWNVAISPDESIAALSSAYAKDPNIYFFDGSVVSKFPLEIAADNTTVAAIDYPDVISWSPNASVPKVAFDCFSEAQLNGSTYGYWSIYEMTFGGSAYAVVNMIPSQPAGYDIGNISYSSTDPELVAFNAFDPDGIEDVVLADFDSNQVVALNIPGRSINGNPVIDGDRPTFSPNDGFLTWSSADNTSLMFLNGTNAAVTYLQYPFAMHKPYWFLLGGSAGVDVKTNPAVALRVVPGIVSRQATIEFSLERSEAVTIDLLNLYGATVRTLTNSSFGEGMSSVTFDRGDLASGTYFVRLRYAGGQVVCKLMVE